MAIDTLHNSEMPDTLLADEYFDSGIDTLDRDGVEKVDLFIIITHIFILIAVTIFAWLSGTDFHTFIRCFSKGR